MELVTIMLVVLSIVKLFLKSDRHFMIMAYASVELHQPHWLNGTSKAVTILNQVTEKPSLNNTFYVLLTAWRM